MVISKDSELPAETDFMYRQISPKKRYIFAVGMFGTQLYNGTQASATLWFWLNIMKMDQNAYSLIMLVFFNIWNAINDPIFGYLSDRTRTRWGRRLPWMRVFTPIWFTCFMMLFIPPLGLDQIGLIIWFTITILLFDMCYSIVAGCYNSLLPELSTITTERALLNTLASIFSAIGNGIAYIFPILLKGNVFQFQLFVIIAGSSAMLVLFIPSFFLRERPIPESETPLGFRQAIVETFKNKPFLYFCGWNFLVQGTTTFLISNVIFFSTHVLGEGGTSGTLLFVILLGAALPGYFVWLRVNKTKGTRITMMFSTLFLAFGLFGLSFIQTYLEASIFLAIAGFGTSGPLIFAYVMIAECTDVDEIRTGRRREAMYFSTNALITKPAIGLAQAIMAWTLLFSGFISDVVDPATGNVFPQPQPATAILGIRIIMGVLPGLFIAAGWFFLYKYPLTPLALVKLKQDLARVHKEKYAEVEK